LKRIGLLKLVIGVSLVAVLAISIPMISGCAGPSPAPTPEPTPEPAAEGQTWHLRGISPQVLGIVQRDSIAHYCDIVEEMSGGRVTFDWYAGGDLMPSEEEIPALKAGTIDMLQWYPLMGTATELRTIEAGAAFMTRNAIEFRNLIYHRGLYELFEDSYTEQGIVYLGPALHDPLSIALSTPAYNLDDLQGKRIMFVPDLGDPWFKAGVAPMPTPPADVYLAIQTGTLDGFAWSGADEIVQFGMNEVAPYLITPPYVDCANVAYLINEDVWATMPDDIQAILTYATREMDIWSESIRANGETLRRVDGSFTEICFLDDESVNTLREYSMEFLIEEVATRNARCAQAVQIIQDYWKELDHAGWHVLEVPSGTGIPGLISD